MMLKRNVHKIQFCNSAAVHEKFMLKDGLHGRASDEPLSNGDRRQKRVKNKKGD
jgi:hypothetical protein